MPLSILIWWPLAFALVGALAGARWAPRIVLGGSLITLGLAVYYLFAFNPHASGLQFVTDETWIPVLGIHYKLGLDGLNLFLVALAALLFAAGIGAANLREWDRPRLFYFHFALAESAVLGAFCAQDLALFVVFFDLMLIPFYFLIGVWGGGPDRVRATTKLVIYTLVGSLLMLAGAIATGVLAGGQEHITFVLSELQKLPLSKGSQEWIFLFFAAAFLVKMPAFPVHGWMPDGYRAMPLPVLAVFSAVLSKVAAYGFLRIVLPLYPDAAAHFQTLLLLIALASILYGSIMAFTVTDARLVVGYSSVAQLGFITLGIFALNPQGAQGALLQMVNHGLVTAALFLIIALLAAPRGRLRGHPRHGRHRVPRTRARGAVPDRRARDPGDAGLGQLHRRVLHPARRLQLEAGDRDHRVHRRRLRQRVHAARLHPHDARPRRARASTRSRSRCATASCSCRSCW